MGDENEKVMIYHYRGDGSILKDNLGQKTRGQLKNILENHPNLQATYRPIRDEERDSKGDAHIEVQQNDLYTPQQKELYKPVSLFNYFTNIAGVFIKSHEAQHFTELVILSKKKS